MGSRGLSLLLPRWLLLKCSGSVQIISISQTELPEYSSPSQVRLSGIFNLMKKAPIMPFIIVFNLMIIGLTYLIEKSRLGDYFEAIREDEDAAQGLGVDTFKYKLLALGISSFLTALGGTFYAQYSLYIDPHICFGVGNSIEILIRPILGGLGTYSRPNSGCPLPGPRVGGCPGTFERMEWRLPDYLRSNPGSGHHFSTRGYCRLCQKTIVPKIKTRGPG